MKRCIAMAALLLITGCVSYGTKIDSSKMSAFRKGETTYGQVVQSLGQPTQTMITDSGEKIIYYSYFSAQARPEGFIPIVGLVAGGADSQNSTVTMTFDRNDILKSYASSQGSVGSGRGLEGHAIPINRAQPNRVGE